MKPLISFIVILISIHCLGQKEVIPTPYYADYKHEQMSLESISIDTNAFEFNLISYLSQFIQRNSKIELVEGGSESTITGKWITSDSEQYVLRIDNNINIEYSSNEMAFAAINSLLQLMTYHKDRIEFPEVEIHDHPRFEWRGLHLDVSRHFFTVDEIKKYIDNMALYKFNKFHWHLTDDQGWRIEIKKYPLLTEIGGFRDSTVIGHYNDSPRKYETIKYGGFYTQEQISEIVHYAADRYIEVIPEIEMPGHSQAAIAAYPELSCRQESLPVSGLWGVRDDIYCSRPETIAFMKDVLSEVLVLFPSEYIHVGGDEAPKLRWKECADCQKVIKQHGLKDEHELQSYFIQQMDEYLSANGRKLIGWDEILEGGLSPNAAVMSWRGEAGGVEAAELNHEVVMSPTTYCYFDYYQGLENEPLAIGGYLPLEKVYKYQVIPEEVQQDKYQYFLGGQANLWTEYMSTMSQVEYMAYPRVLALIEALWCEEKPSYNEFLDQLINQQFDYLEQNGINASKSVLMPRFAIERTAKGVKYYFIQLNGDTSTVSYEKDMMLVENDENVYIYNTADRGYKVSWSNEEFHVDRKLHIHDAIGASIHVHPDPHPKYNNNGSLNLVDGIRKGETWRGSEWLGFTDSIIEIELLLEQKEKIDSVSIGFLDQNGSWIYLPEKVEVFKMNWRGRWKSVGEISISQDFGERYFWTKKMKSDKVKFKVYSIGKIPAGNGGAGYPAWTFIDEVEVYASSKK